MSETNRKSNKLGVLASALTLLTLLSATVTADEHAGKAWPDSQQVSMDQVDHAPFDQLLQKYVNDNGMVAYKTWHANASDRKQLQDYLASLGRGSLTKPASADAQLAFWINAYNATTIEGIMRVYPTSSIRKHTAKLVGYNIWKNLLLHVGDRQISLEDIENKVLRKMGDPRIHFAIVCASIGCPRLLNHAYTADSVKQQLATNSQDFFSRSQNLQVSGNTLAVSKIMEWYGTDFAPTPQAQMKKLETYLPDAAKQVVNQGNFRVAYQEYNWDLNEQK